MPIRTHFEHILRFPAAVLCFFLMTIGGTGCFPMGLPEKFADLSKTDSRNPRYAVVISPEAGSLAEFHETPLLHRALGSQFLLGIIPFTKVFFQHTEREFLKEVLINSLQDEGYTVIMLPQGTEISIPGPDLIVSASLPDLSVNAYDAIFFRIVRVTGNLSVTFHEAAPGFPDAWQETLKLDRTQYRAYAPAALLTASVESELKKALGSSLRIIRQRRHSALCRSRASQLVIVPPSISNGEGSLGKYLLTSYGISAGRGYTSGEAARIIQRGLLLGAASANLSAAASTNRLPPVHCPQQPAVLEASVLETAAKKGDFLSSPSLHLRLALRLLESNGTKLAANTCIAELKQRKNLDGSAVLAFEEAAAEAAHAFLTGRGKDSIKCSTQELQQVTP